MFNQAQSIGAMEPRLSPGDSSNAWWSWDESPGRTGSDQHRRVLSYVASDPPFSNNCTNSTTGQTYKCNTQQYPVLVIVVAGIISMVFLVSVALVLLMCSFYKRRGTREQLQGAQVVPSSAPASDAIAATTASDDFVLVYMPGDDEPAGFARPVPFCKEDYDSKSIGGTEHELDSFADGKDKGPVLETALPVPNIPGALSMSRQGSLTSHQRRPSSSPRQGFQISRHGSLRLERSTSVSSLSAEPRSSSFPRRQSRTDPLTMDPEDSRTNIDGDLQEQQQSRLAADMGGGLQMDATLEMRSLSMSREGSLRFQRLRPSSNTPRELLLSRHASLRFEHSRSVAALFEGEGARSLSFPRRQMDTGLSVLHGDDRVLLLQNE